MASSLVGVLDVPVDGLLGVVTALKMEPKSIVSYRRLMCRASILVRRVPLALAERIIIAYRRYAYVCVCAVRLAFVLPPELLHEPLAALALPKLVVEE